MSSTTSRRGRPPAFGDVELFDAAVAVAERDGLAALTLKTVARELGVTPMAIYRVVDSKDDLLARLPDHLAVDVEPGLGDAADGVAALAHVAVRLGEILDRRPAVAPLFNRPTVGPTMERLAAVCITKLTDQGASPERAAGLLRATVAMVVGLRVTGGESAGDAIGPMAADAVDIWLSGVAEALRVEASG